MSGPSEQGLALLVLRNRQAVALARLVKCPAPFRRCAWNVALPWYNPLTPPVMDGNFFGNFCHGRLRETMQGIAKYDRVAGILGILPPGLMDALRPDRSHMPERQRKEYDRLTASWERSLRCLLLTASSRVYGQWISAVQLMDNSTNNVSPRAQEDRDPTRVRGARDSPPLATAAHPWWLGAVQRASQPSSRPPGGRYPTAP
jgi:hypothetical protein